MLTIIILIALLISFYSGYRRGLVLQLIRLVGYIITFVLATRYFQPLSEIVEMLIPFPSVQPDTNLAFYDEATSFFIDDAFYRVITFILIGLIGWVISFRAFVVASMNDAASTKWAGLWPKVEQ